MVPGIVVVVLALLAGILLSQRNREPVYEGRQLSYWLAQLYKTNNNASSQAASAVSQMGTNAIPSLLRMLRTHVRHSKPKCSHGLSRHGSGKFHYTDPSDIQERAQLGFELLGSKAAMAVPELIEILNQKCFPGIENRDHGRPRMDWSGSEGRRSIAFTSRRQHEYIDAPMGGLGAHSDSCRPERSGPGFYNRTPGYQLSGIVGRR